MSTGAQMGIRAAIALALAGPLAPMTAPGADAPIPPGTVPDRPIVRLPPFFAEGHRIRNFRYSAVPGFEVLSNCSPKVTASFIVGFYRQFSVLSDIAPMVSGTPASMPTALILLNSGLEQTMRQDMVEATMRLGVDARSAADGPQSGTIIVPQLRISDGESTAIDFILPDEDSFQTVKIEPAYVQFLMESRRPRLPAWFTVAVNELYRRAYFDADSTHFPPAYWVSDKDTFGLQKDPQYPRNLLSMGDIVAAPLPVPGRNGYSRMGYRLWLSQAELFLRWAIDGRADGRLRMLKDFLARTEAGQIDEAWFQQCFHLDFAAMQGRLGEYLPSAVKYPLIVPVRIDFDSHNVKMRDATEAEYARIWGDWQRREIGFVKAQDPAYVHRYVEQADHTLAEAYRDGERDPGFLAVMGLYETEIGDDGKASGFLESAVAAGAVRPRAYTELARIRFNLARIKPAGIGGRLGAEQVASVLAPLRAARRLSPPQFDTYVLFATTLLQGVTVPDRDDMALLDEGLRLFPADSRLAPMVAELRARH